MKTLLTIWLASFRSSFGAMRQDARLRTALLIGLFVQAVFSVWAVTRLQPLFAAWSARGTLALQRNLWLLFLLAWALIGLFSVLSTLTYGLASNEALLLATQPVEPATRIRALYGLVLFKGVGNWLIFEAGVAGIALTSVLGWQALPWLLLLIIGAALVTWLSLIATLLVVRYVLPHLLWLAGLLLLFALFLALLGFIAHLTGWTFAFPDVARFPLPSPVFLLLWVFLLLLCALFPLAPYTGRLYLAALESAQSRGGPARVRVFPGMRALLRLFARSRGLTGALLSKGLLNQSRHSFAWARLLVVLILLALFSPVRPWLLSLGLGPVSQVVSYAAFLVFLLLIEYTPYAISSESNRLALYLALPAGLPVFLRARLLSFLLPAWFCGLCLTLLLGLWISLSWQALLLALALVALLLTGYVAFTVLGSALDENLSSAIEDSVQALMQEEMPITPRRLQLLGLTVLVSGSLLVLVWKLPLLLALPVLALLDGAILLLMWRLSLASLSRLLR